MSTATPVDQDVATVEFVLDAFLRARGRAQRVLNTAFVGLAPDPHTPHVYESALYAAVMEPDSTVAAYIVLVKDYTESHPHGLQRWISMDTFGEASLTEHRGVPRALLQQLSPTTDPDALTWRERAHAHCTDCDNALGAVVRLPRPLTIAHDSVHVVRVLHIAADTHSQVVHLQPMRLGPDGTPVDLDTGAVTAQMHLLHDGLEILIPAPSTTATAPEHSVHTPAQAENASHDRSAGRRSDWGSPVPVVAIVHDWADNPELSESQRAHLHSLDRKQVVLARDAAYTLHSDQWRQLHDAIVADATALLLNTLPTSEHTQHAASAAVAADGGTTAGGAAAEHVPAPYLPEAGEMGGPAL
jgi:hypothetical protein